MGTTAVLPLLCARLARVCVNRQCRWTYRDEERVVTVLDETLDALWKKNPAPEQHTGAHLRRNPRYQSIRAYFWQEFNPAIHLHFSLYVIGQLQENLEGGLKYTDLRNSETTGENDT